MSVREVKICLLGDSGVGKSSIVTRFVRDSFRNAQESTIGASFMTKRLEVDNVHYLFQIWDTAGQEKYRALAPMYYRGAAAAIVVYDVTREATFQAVRSWIKELQRNGSPNIVLAIAGNKCDLEDLREVQQKDMDEFARQINAIFIETSALSAVNVLELFTQIAKKLPQEDYAGVRAGSGTVRLKKQAPSQSSGCCSGRKRQNSQGTPERF